MIMIIVFEFYYWHSLVLIFGLQEKNVRSARALTHHINKKTLEALSKSSSKRSIRSGEEDLTTRRVRTTWLAQLQALSSIETSRVRTSKAATWLHFIRQIRQRSESSSSMDSSVDFSTRFSSSMGSSGSSEHPSTSSPLQTFALPVRVFLSVRVFFIFPQKVATIETVTSATGSRTSWQEFTKISVLSGTNREDALAV